MPQVTKKLTPATPDVVLGAMAYAYKQVTGVLPPSFNAILLPTAQSALETAAWKAMWNWNAGNVTTGKPNTDNWIDLSSVSSATSGIKFKAYPNLGAGCVDMLTWLQKRGILALATNGDVGAYTNGLAASCYAGCPGQAGAADYGQYASILYSYTQKYQNVVPRSYSPGVGLVGSIALGAALIGVTGALAYALLPERTLARIGFASENPLPDESGQESDEESEESDEFESDEAEEGADEKESGEEEESGHEGEEGQEEASVAEIDSTHVQTLLFKRDEGWTIPKARSWIRSHPPYRVSKIDETERSIRFRQVDPKKFRKGSFRTITFGKGIKAVIGKRRTI